MRRSIPKKSILIILSIVIILIIIAIVLISNPGRGEKKYTFAAVSVGNVCKIIEADGETVSENEVIMLSPGSAIVKQIIKVPGSHIEKGDVILKLDESEIRNNLDAITDELDLLQNTLHKLQLSAKTTTIDLEHDVEVKKLTIASLKAELEDQEELLNVGGISQAKIEKTKQELVLAEKEYERSSQKHKIRLNQLEAEQKDIDLKIKMKEKQVTAIQRQLTLMIVRSPVTGVLLEVRARTGERMKKDELLVRISEHTRLKIKGEIPEKNSNLIRNGGKVYVPLANVHLSGVIGNINPVLEDNKIQFDVFLNNPQNDKLKINQKVKLLIVEEEKNNVLRVPKGEYFRTSRTQCNVLVNSDIYTKKIKTGLIGFEYIEIIQGLEPNDLVINSSYIRTRKLRNSNTTKIE